MPVQVQISVHVVECEVKSCLARYVRALQMRVDEAVKLIDAVTKLFNVFVWPVTFIFFLIWFGPALRKFISSLGELSVKFPGFEAVMKRKQVEAAVALASATASRSNQMVSPEFAAGVAMNITPSAVMKAEKSTILWVDDNPENNIYERRAFEILGVTFVLATSTEQALEKLRYQHFDMIISDNNRPPDSQAGYTLLNSLRSNGNQTPFLIYAGTIAPEYVAEAQQRGAISYTNKPDKLFSLVLSTLEH